MDCADPFPPEVALAETRKIEPVAVMIGDEGNDLAKAAVRSGDPTDFNVVRTIEGVAQSCPGSNLSAPSNCAAALFKMPPY